MAREFPGLAQLTEETEHISSCAEVLKIKRIHGDHVWSLQQDVYWSLTHSDGIF